MVGCIEILQPGNSLFRGIGEQDNGQASREENLPLFHAWTERLGETYKRSPSFFYLEVDCAMFYVLNYNSPHETSAIFNIEDSTSAKNGLKKRSKKVLDEMLGDMIYYKSRR